MASVPRIGVDGRPIRHGGRGPALPPAGEYATKAGLADFPYPS
jgi:hypothetical protein